MKLTDAKIAIAKANRTRLDAITDIADRVLAGVVGPFCDKYQLTFLSGNGTYTFAFIEDEDKPRNEQRQIGGYTSFAAEDLARFGVPADEAARIAEALEWDADRHTRLYEHMTDYDPRTAPTWNEPPREEVIPEKSIAEKGASILRKIDTLREKEAEVDRLLLELRGVAEIMAQGIDPKRIRTWKPWWPRGHQTTRPKGTEFRLKTESGKPEDDERLVVKGFLPSNWKKRLHLTEGR